MAEQRLLIVIPARNEARFIGPLVRAVRGHAPEVLVVDDGSTDSTAALAGEAGARVIRHPVNRGKGRALETAFLYALEQGYAAVLTMDGDGQHDPADIPVLLERFRVGDAGVVVGCRARHPGNMPLDRFLTNGLTSRLVSFLAGRRICDSQCGFRVFDSRVLAWLSFSTAHFDAESEMLVEASRAGFVIAEVPVKTIYGLEESKQEPLRGTVRFCRFFIRGLGRKLAGRRPRRFRRLPRRFRPGRPAAGGGRRGPGAGR